MTLADNRADVVVVGGGLAGISAAIELAEAGLRVTLLEARPWLGGATCSFARRGLTIDNGQHAYLRGFEAYLDLLAKLGVLGAVESQERLWLPVLGGAAPQTVRRSGLPAPLHLASALAGYRLLTPPERVTAAAAAIGLQWTARRGPGDEDLSLGDWLDARGQTGNARRMLWDLLSFGALGLPSAEADLGVAAAAMRRMLSSRQNTDLGVPLVPLSRLHAAPAVALLSRLGCRVLPGVRAAGCQLSRDGGFDIVVAPAAPVAGAVEAGGSAPTGSARPRVIRSAALVLAVPAWEAAVIAPPELATQAAHWARFEPSPVVSVHVVYGSPVTSLPFAAVVDSPVRWVMDKTGPAGLHTGQYLAASVPDARSYVDLPASRLRAELLPELERLFPAATDADVEDFFTTRERRALIRQIPGSERLRASQPVLRGLALAGAWTDTGWPDTMEGAVRSGLRAAWKVLSELAGGGVASHGLAGHGLTGYGPAGYLPDASTAGLAGHDAAAQGGGPASLAPAR